MLVIFKISKLNVSHFFNFKTQYQFSLHRTTHFRIKEWDNYLGPLKCSRNQEVKSNSDTRSTCRLSYQIQCALFIHTMARWRGRLVPKMFAGSFCPEYKQWLQKLCEIFWRHLINWTRWMINYIFSDEWVSKGGTGERLSLQRSSIATFERTSRRKLYASKECWGSLSSQSVFGWKKSWQEQEHGIKFSMRRAFKWILHFRLLMFNYTVFVPVEKFLDFYSKIGNCILFNFLHSYLANKIPL